MKEREDTRRVLTVAGLLFGGVALAAIASDLHSQLAAGELAALGAFLALFAAATYGLDAEIRAYVNGLLRRAPGTSPAPKPAAPSSARTSAPGWDATRGQPGD